VCQPVGCAAPGWLRWLADNRKVLGFGERQARLYLHEPASRDADLATHPRLRTAGALSRMSFTSSTRRPSDRASLAAFRVLARARKAPEDRGRSVRRGSPVTGITLGTTNYVSVIRHI
jgi:hypothetical protein